MALMTKFASTLQVKSPFKDFQVITNSTLRVQRAFERQLKPLTICNSLHWVANALSKASHCLALRNLQGPIGIFIEHEQETLHFQPSPLPNRLDLL